MQLEFCPLLFLLLFRQAAGQWTSYRSCPAGCLNSADCIMDNFLECSCMPDEVTAAVGDLSGDDLCGYIVYIMTLPPPSCCANNKRANTLTTRSSIPPVKSIGHQDGRWLINMDDGGALKEKKDNVSPSSADAFRSLNNMLLAKAVKIIQELREEIHQRDATVRDSKVLGSAKVAGSKLYQSLRCYPTSAVTDRDPSFNLLNADESQKQ